jgi:hypothetical protein
MRPWATQAKNFCDWQCLNWDPSATSNAEFAVMQNSSHQVC